MIRLNSIENKNKDSFTYLNNALCLSEDNKKYIYKEKTDKFIYPYLKAKGFYNFLEPIETNSLYDKYEYLKNYNNEKSDQAISFITLLSFLHNKTTSYELLDLDLIKEKYELVQEKIKNLNYYYHDLQDSIESKVYFSPAEYVLMRNMSLIYELLTYSKTNIDYWYNEVIKTKKIRKVLLHGKASLEHFIENEDKILINWAHAHKDIPIYDFLYFYQSHYLELDMNSLFEIYNSKYKLTNIETAYFMALISLVDKISIEDYKYKTYTKINRFTNYLNITKEFILKQNKKYEEEKSNEL